MQSHQFPLQCNDMGYFLLLCICALRLLSFVKLDTRLMFFKSDSISLYEVYLARAAQLDCLPLLGEAEVDLTAKCLWIMPEMFNID